MNPGLSRLRRAIGLLVAVGVVCTLYVFSQSPTLAEAETEAITARFRFEKLAFPEPTGFTRKSVREVHPSLAHLSGYLSAVGAAAALSDIDGDGLPNDLCYVDPRIDQVIIAPTPGTPQERYELFVLPLGGGLPFDSAMAPTGCLPGDFNEDGLTDVLVCFWGRTPIIYLQRPAANDKKLTAQSFVACELLAPWQRWQSCSATLADLDGDGHYDLIVGNHSPDGAAYLDPNGSGRLQMPESQSRAFNGGGPHFFLWRKPEGPTPTVRFEKVEPEIILPRNANSRTAHDACHGWTLALGAADLDGDGLPEIYVSNDFGPDRLLHNRSEPGKLRFAILEGERGFVTPRSRVLGQDSFKSMGVDFGDVNGDGWLDMYVSNISAPYSLFESHFLWMSTGNVGQMKQGIAPYIDAGEQLGLSRSGWGWDCRLADFDNDSVLEAVQAMGFLKGSINRWPEGQELAAANDQLTSDPRAWPDFRPGADFSGSNHNRFYVRAADGRFYDFSQRLGLDTPMVTRGLALADIDGDGRLDFAVANQWEQSFLFRNTAPSPGAFLGLHLRLPVGPQTTGKTVVLNGHPRSDRPSRPAIGAAATVHLRDGRRLVSQVDGGSGHSGKRAPDIHFGLGDVVASELLNVDVRWRGPDGKLRSQTIQVTPGWHTVLLGTEPPEGR